VLSNSRDIKNLDKVFGFAAQMYNNCAFIFRQGGGVNGTHFMAYVPAAVPTNNSMLLDATADIDKVSQLCSWRSPVPVPEVSFNNLRIVHIHPLMSGNLNELFRKEANRRDYAAHAIKVIKELMPVSARGLVICKKALVDHGEILKTTPETDRDGQSVNPFTWDLDERHLAVTWWGGHGIGVNDWKEAEYVFQFGEHILPSRTMFAMVQGLRGDKATSGILSTTKSSNSRPQEVTLATEGHLLRFIKQLGMRGRARSFDQDGVCGKQVLVLTCDFERLLLHADQLFPGATLSKWGRTQEHYRSLTQAEMLMELLTDPDQPDNIDGDVIAQDMGLKRWGSGSSNVMRRKDKMERILRNLGWTYVPKRGPGGGSSFIKTGSAVLKTRAWNGQHGALQAAAG
jgi:hypothetical protein